MSKNMQFGADADIYINKKWWNSDACIENHWYLINSRYLHKIIEISVVTLYLQ